MIEAIRTFLKPNKEKRNIFVLLVPLVILFFLVGSALTGFIDSPIKGKYPIADWSVDTLGYQTTYQLGILMFIPFFLLFFPAMILAFPFMIIPIPYVAIAAFIVLEAAYIHVIACFIYAAWNFIRTKGDKK